MFISITYVKKYLYVTINEEVKYTVSHQELTRPYRKVLSAGVFNMMFNFFTHCQTRIKDPKVM